MATAARVWPPILLGRRRVHAFDNPCVHSDAPKITLPRRVYPANPNVTFMKEITIDSIKTDEGPLYVFPPSVEGHMWAVVIAQFSREPVPVYRPWLPLNTKFWTLKYATVKDMSEVDHHRKLVDWNVMPFSFPGSAISKDISSDTISVIGTPPCLSATQSEEFQGKLLAIRDAQISLQKCVEETIEADKFASELRSILFQDLPGEAIKNLVLKKIDARKSFMRDAFTFDGPHVATASFERLSSLGVGEIHESLLISKLINRGTELELKALQSTAEEIGRATTNKRKLAQLQLDHLESTRNLVAKQRREMIQHLWEWASKFEIIMEEEMLSRAKLIKSIQQAEQTIPAIQKFISAGATEKDAEVYSDALKAIREQDHASSLTKHRELAVTNQNCCICFNELEGFSVSSGHGESFSSKKLQKTRACFLPCMHANVCTTCSAKRWNDGPKECPICRQQLTENPRVIYL